MTSVKIHYPCFSKAPQSFMVKVMLSANVTKSDIQKYYKSVYQTQLSKYSCELVDDNDVNCYLQSLFELFNSDNNPLSTKEHQQYIKENELHTSMSVGDVISVNERFYVVGMGFKEVIN